MNRPVIRLVFAAMLASASGALLAAPAAGDTYVYRVVNGYNNETRGQISYRIESVADDRVTVAVTPDPSLLGQPHTEIYTADGNWLRHPVTNHDQPVEHEFSPPYPAYLFPLDTGKSWSVRVTATDVASGQRRSVRVDADVLGNERITTPVGAFDTIKVRRRTYAGDWEQWREETHITETDWYAPALGRPVRSESNSGYMDQIMCGIMNICEPMKGDWNLIELVSVGRK